MKARCPAPWPHRHTFPLACTESAATLHLWLNRRHHVDNSINTQTDLHLMRTTVSKNLSVFPGCKTLQRSVWSDASPLKVAKRASLSGSPVAAVSGDISTASSQESLCASAAHPDWRLSAPSSPTASLPAGTRGFLNVVSR